VRTWASSTGWQRRQRPIFRTFLTFTSVKSGREIYPPSRSATTHSPAQCGANKWQIRFPEDFDTLLTRDQTAVALTQAGFPVRSATLATKACRGGGPDFKLFGTRPLYRWGDALAWAQAKLTAPRRKADQCEAA